MKSIYSEMDKMQHLAKNKVLKALNKKNEALIVSATGTGKTEIAAKIIDKINKSSKILWITHQNELVDQVAKRLNDRLGIDVSIFNGSTKDMSGKVVVASVQSISKTANLKKFKKKYFNFLFIDECHHAPAQTWNKTIDYFQAKKIGMTATHKRPDGQSVTDIFGSPVFELPFEDAQRKKFLAKDWNRVILTNSTIEGFTAKHKDYSEKQLDKLYVSHERNRIILDSYLKYGRKKVISSGMKPKAVCFCINVKHAIRMSKMFQDAGIPSAFICGDKKYQSSKERSEVMDSFRNSNKIEILCAVNIFNEGIDIPEANIGLMVRPTRSNIVYQQQVGRIARSNGGKKKFFVVLDFVDVTRQEYSGYIMGNLKKKGISHGNIVADFLKEKDPILVNQRVTNIMASVREFERLVDVIVTKQNINAHLEAISQGKILKTRLIL